MIAEKLEGRGMTSGRARDRLIRRLQESGIQDLSVLEAVRNTPRHLFVDEAMSHRVYEEVSLPIGFSQTLSQPYIVAKMTELLLANGAMNKVLEVGTGSGYQTAILAQLVGRVYSVERIKPLQNRARGLLSKLKYSNVNLKHTDGAAGWVEHAPFDGILVTAAPTTIPLALVAQLKVGGRLVIPVGGEDEQSLHLIVKTEGGFDDHVLEEVQFVPLLAGRVR